MLPATWLGFAAASIVLLLIPGPTVLLVVSYALGQGRPARAATIGGVALGALVAMTASLAGLGALLATSATVFGALRWVGALYLLYLGVKLWRAPVALTVDGSPPPVGAGRMLLHAFAVTALNPKYIAFFVAFVPEFIDADRFLLPQLIQLEATFVLLAALNAFAYAMLASSARRFIRRPATQRAVNRVGGGFMIGAGLLAMAWKRA